MNESLDIMLQVRSRVSEELRMFKGEEGRWADVTTWTIGDDNEERRNPIITQVKSSMKYMRENFTEHRFRVKTIKSEVIHDIDGMDSHFKKDSEILSSEIEKIFDKA